MRWGIAAIWICLTGCAPKPWRAFESPQAPVGVRHVPASTPGLVLGEPTCAASEAFVPEEVRLGALSGVVTFNVVVEPDGSIDPGLQLYDDRAAPALVKAARDRFLTCKYPPPTLEGEPVAVVFSKSIGFHGRRAPLPAPTEAIVDLTDTIPSDFTVPKSLPCSPVGPLQKGSAKLEFVIHSNGLATDVRSVDADADPTAVALSKVWIESCPFEPARDATGKAITARVRHYAGSTAPAWNRLPTDAEVENSDAVPVLLGAGMERPRPTPECEPKRPVPTEFVMRRGIQGMVLVEFVVHRDGHVGEIVLKNPTAPPELFDAVESWMKKCPHEPARYKGKPLAVKILQPFNFRAGL
ncbi:MAG: TonB family protein [Deltaproteobacteria bacterium]|nr:TonB family protein [Deltaproteobacteria bacterium]